MSKIFKHVINIKIIIYIIIRYMYLNLQNLVASDSRFRQCTPEGKARETGPTPCPGQTKLGVSGQESLLMPSWMPASQGTEQGKEVDREEIKGNRKNALSIFWTNDQPTHGWNFRYIQQDIQDSIKNKPKTTRDIMLSDSFVRIYCHIRQQKKRTERHIS